MRHSSGLRWASTLSHRSNIRPYKLPIRAPYPSLTCHLSTVSTSSQHGSTSSSRSWSSICSRTAPPPPIPLPRIPTSLTTTNGNTAIAARSSLHSSTSPSYLSPSSTRHASSSSNQRWITRQKSDRFAREAKVANLKSRAAFKLLQINERYRIFHPGQTVVDLGFAPGSWSQVAIELVRPGLGRVVGVDLIPAAPPKGVNAIQGDFLSDDTQERLRELLRDESAGRVKRSLLVEEESSNSSNSDVGAVPVHGQETGQSYIEQQDRTTTSVDVDTDTNSTAKKSAHAEDEKHGEKCVDVVLSDMSAPWEILTSSNLSGKNSLSNPYYRLMNTSGNRFKDHAGSMDLCRSALYFAYDTLKIGGHFVCKFYQGAEDKILEKQLKAMFHKVHREKPESSRSESKEAFFVGIKRLAKVDRHAVFDEGV